MRSVIGYFIGILLLINTSCFSQEVSLPDSIITKIVVELAEKDHLSFVVNVQDSTLKVYHHSDSLQKEEIKTYKVEIGNGKLIITKLNVTIKLNEMEIYDLKQGVKKGKWRRITSFLEGVAVGIVLLLIYGVAK